MATRPLMILLVAFQFAQPTFALVTSDEAGSHRTTPGQPSFGVNVDGVGVVAFDVPGAQFDDLIPFCTGALITDRHVLSAAHCYDEDADGQVDEILIEFPTLIAFEPPEEEPLLFSVDTLSVQIPAQWPETMADLAILQLSEDVPDSLPRYPLYGRTDAVGRRAVLVGSRR